TKQALLIANNYLQQQFANPTISPLNHH
ncbi:transcriptional regulator BetI, partial [Vibrio cholerae]